ncbi:hypothetical protein KIPB_006158 [Kipferlia bialata]|uniref:Kelch-type beta propeller n=1 Tax=Kipferlia bialata TaxID=797122 RepID=A0A391NUE0_9EUKA|nr:hypothetical protein KIPB_006158 [Kipferlia bialata]|eukprot:g6158.t1
MFKFRLSHVGHRGNRSGMAYIGGLTAEGDIDPYSETLGRVIIVGENSQTSSDNCVIATLDAETGSMSHRAIPCPVPALRLSTATRVGEWVFVFGGNPGSVDTLYRFDIATEKWTQVQKRGVWPKGRWGQGAFSLGGKLFIAAGCDGSKISSAWVFDPQGETWTQLPDYPVGLQRPAVCTVGDRVHLIGGSAPTTHCTYSEAGGWHKEADLPFRVYGAGAVAVGSNIHVMGGNGHSNQVHVYDTVTKRWEESGTLPVSFSYGSACYTTPSSVIIHSEKQLIIGESEELKQKPERERLAQEERDRVAAQLAEAERQRVYQEQVSLLHSLVTDLGCDVEGVASLTPEECRHHILCTVAAREVDRRKTELCPRFSAFDPSSLPPLRTLISDAKAFDADALSTALANLSEYLPLAERIDPQVLSLTPLSLSVLP